MSPPNRRSKAFQRKQQPHFVVDIDQWCDEDARKAAHQPTRDERQGTHQRHVDPDRQRTVDVDRGRQHRLADPRITVEQLQGEDD